LPDGRVVIAGSTGHSWTTAALSGGKHFEHNIEIFSPPYLLGSPIRPQATNIPSSISCGSNFDIGMDDPDNIELVSLIRLSSTTHNNNMDQRCIMLPVIGRTTNALSLAGPKDGTWAPPGYYMLFLVDVNGVPSEGKIVSVG
jgi:hypothetical protein